jgi:hypothetical protein
MNNREIIRFDLLRSNLAPAHNLRLINRRSCGSCGHWIIAGNMGHCERVSGYHGRIETGHLHVCDMWENLLDERITE